MHGIESLKRQELEKRVDDYTLLDDALMMAALNDSVEATQVILRTVIGDEGLEVESVQTAKRSGDMTGHDVVMDVMALSSDGRYMNIEVQSGDAGAIPKRARYHMSVMDRYCLDKGGYYRDLAESYVIFITRNDVLGGGLPIYHIERKVEETGKDFGDEAHIIYVNCAWQPQGGELSALEMLIEDFKCPEPARMHFKELAQRVGKVKDDPAWRDTMIDDLYQEAVRIGLEQGRAEGEAAGFAAGLAEGEAKGNANAIKALMTNANMDFDAAADMLSIPADDRQHIKELVLA